MNNDGWESEIIVNLYVRTFLKYYVIKGARYISTDNGIARFCFVL